MESKPCFEHCAALEGTRFCVSDYVRTFASRLGLELAAYNAMDGQRLVPYQCVVAHKDMYFVNVQGAPNSFSVPFFRVILCGGYRRKLPTRARSGMQ